MTAIARYVDVYAGTGLVIVVVSWEAASLEFFSFLFESCCTCWIAWNFSLQLDWKRSNADLFASKSGLERLCNLSLGMSISDEMHDSIEGTVSYAG